MDTRCHLRHSRFVDHRMTEAERLVAARNTLKVVWSAYRADSDYIDETDRDVRIAREVALDEIDLALLRMDDVDLTFKLEEGDNE